MVKSEEKKREDFIIMGIESSCDETAVSLVKGGRKILADRIISSSGEHVKFGGVVPEIASRAHTEAIGVAAKGALSDAGLKMQEVDAIAVTYGAGLLGALLVGVSYAKALAYGLGIPLIPVNHIRGHIAASYLETDLEPPFITLLASGGHTAIIRADSYVDLTVLGSTLDDAAGEAFDKVARVLGLPYPGGPNIQRCAENKSDDWDNIKFPKMLKDKKNYDFSFSGLKTAVINEVEREQRAGRLRREDIAASFQKTVVDELVKRAVRALAESGISTLTAGGGVAANALLRARLKEECEKKKIRLYLPPVKLCTDNAAMIAAEGFIGYFYRGKRADMALNAKASLNIEE